MLLLKIKIINYSKKKKKCRRSDSALIVSQLINPSHKGWDYHKLRNLFDEQTVKAI